MSTNDLYVGREQTLVKHFILQKYLERFAHIVGTFAEAITYVDCFSGPWNVRSEQLKDSSFALALDELRKARTTLAARGRTLKLRCMFLEKQPGPYKKLEEFANQVQGPPNRAVIHFSDSTLHSAERQGDRRRAG